MLKKMCWTTFVCCMALVCIFPLTPLHGITNQIKKGKTAGSLFAPANEAAVSTLSNGLVKLCIDSNAGTCDLIDLEPNEAFVRDAEVVMAIAPCRKLDGVKQEDSEAAGPAKEYRSSLASNRIETGPYSSALGTGNALTLISAFGYDAEVRIRFTLYPGQRFVDVGWGYRHVM